MTGAAEARLPVLLVTGQSNQYHAWQKSSAAIAHILSSCGIFAVTTTVSPASGEDIASFAPRFSDFRAVILDYEGTPWPRSTEVALEAYVASGGGLVIVHASNNAFPHWPAFQQMTGVGGWAGRDESSGPKVRWRDGRMQLDHSAGTAQHPPKHEFQVVTRTPGHPIMRGLPTSWLHANDELYSQLRGPARHLEVLATGFADPAVHDKATGEHEPVLMTIRFGQGRVFHTTLGHAGPDDSPPIPSVGCVGFTATLQRGTEWAATGAVTQALAPDFPAKDRVSVRSPNEK